MDKPQVDRIEGIPPAIAIDQTNPVRTSRSTVGTMTELNDHVKLLYARAAVLYCRNCGREVRRDDAESIYARARARARRRRRRRARARDVHGADPANFSGDEIENFLAGQGYTRIHARTKTAVEVVQDRLTFTPENRARLIEARSALEVGTARQVRPKGHVTVRARCAGHLPATDSGHLQVLGASPLRALRHRVRRLRPEQRSRSTRRSARASSAAASAARSASTIGS